MFYEPKDGHGLKHNPFNAIVSPRPIGWISTRDKAGRDNLAPYSFFNAVAYVPPQVMFAETNAAKPDRDGHKDSVSQLAETGVFCVNVVSAALAEVMNKSSAGRPAGEDEFTYAGIEKAECNVIDCPRVAKAPASMECRVIDVVTLRGTGNHVVFGEVVGIHIDEAVLKDGRFDVLAFNPVARLGYRDFLKVEHLFEMLRPDD